MDTTNIELLQKLQNITTFTEFDGMLCKLSNDEKGIYFEMFYKLYFVLIEHYQILYSNVYLHNEIPNKVKSWLKLPNKDKGIDGIAITKSGEHYAVQVKYRSNTTPIAFGDLATFPALAFGSYCQNIKGGIFFTNCVDVCDELKGEKYQNITHRCFDKCNGTFWNNARDYLSNQIITRNVPYTPLLHQEKILPFIKTHFNDNDYGRLYLPCGTGKSLMGVFTAINMLHCTKVFIVVPSLYLLSETYETWIRQLSNDKDFKYLLIGSDIDKKDYLYGEYKITTTKSTIRDILCCVKDKLILITTYQSSQLLIDICKELDFVFDIGIYDEAHRTVGTSDKKFTALLSNKRLSKKRLFMTATEKIYRYNQTDNLIKDKWEDIFSMDKEDVYGKVIFNYSTLQAIKDGQLVDYNVVAPFMSTDKYDDLLKHNNYVHMADEAHEIKLLAIAIMIIKVLKENNVYHLLLFSNTNERAKQLLNVIDQLLIKEDMTIFTTHLNGTDNMTTRKYRVKLFTESCRGIISSARIFGEGVNIPTCDAVCFADNKSSTVDIIQYVGRCLRKCSAKPNKIALVIVPFVLDANDCDFFNSNSKSFLKLRKILKSLGTTDDMISEKFSLKDCNKILLGNKTDTDESNSELVIGTKLTINEFRQHIITHIFDKNGDPESRIRKKLIYENKRLYINNQDLIDTRNKCLVFLNNECEPHTPITKNWIKFCVGNDIFSELKTKYYYSKNELCNACEQLEIVNFETYKTLHRTDPRLPCPDYINDGFYQDLDEKFNINSLLQVQSSLLEM